MKVHREKSAMIRIIAANFLWGLYCVIGPLVVKAELFVQTGASTIVANNQNDDDNDIKAQFEKARQLRDAGNYEQAVLVQKRINRFTEKIFGSFHPNTAISINMLAILYAEQGLLGIAEPLYIRALEIREKTLGPEHPDTAVSLNNLAWLYSSQGSYGKAERLYLRALAIHSKRLGPNSADTVTNLNNLAGLYYEQGLFRKAEMLWIRVLIINKSVLGLNHPDTALAQGNLAGLYEQMGLLAKSQALYVRSLAVYEKILGPWHPDTIRSINNLGGLYFRRGMYGKAENLLGRVLFVSEARLGSSHQMTAIALSNLAEVYRAQGLYPKAEALFHRRLEIYANLIQREVALVSGIRRSSLLSAIGKGDRAAFSYAQNGPTGANLALFSRLNRQGILEDIEKRQAQLATLPGPQQEAAEQLRAINKQVSSLSLSPQQRKALKIRQEELEVQLYRLLPELKPRIVEVQQVAAALPSTGALVEYQRYQPFDGKKPNSQRWGKPRYLALVLKANGSVAAVDLGPAVVIEERIQQALRATQEQLSDANQLWGQVGKQVLDPLGPALAGVQTLFVSPDGELNRIPFAALPAPGGKTLLSESLQLRLLTTGRELLDLAQPRRQAKTAALVVANPAFDQLASNAPVTAVRPVDPVESPFGIGGQQRSADLATLRWSALPGTAKEGQAIAALTGATLLSGSQASATAIEKQAAPRILHIASHGYFLANQPTSPLAKRSLSNSGLPPMGSLPAANLQGESPLLRSGIVLAGANQNSTATGISPGDRGDDGYLTALEITQLDWKGTELVVISACESGKGDIQAGEGVYGLKRAIAVAGARSSLLSLWKVDDAATAAFMQSFYEKLKTGQGRADALAGTQKEFRNHSDPGWSHPYVWAAFQLSGDWGPIPGI